MPLLNHLYDRSPVALQNLAVNASGWFTARRRFDGRFHVLLERLLGQVELEPEQFAALRDERIRRYVEHCTSTVPHWQRRFSELGIDPRQIRGLDDLSLLPVLTKSEARQIGQDLRSNSWPGHRCTARGTGGTTGASLRFWASQDAVREQWAVWWRAWHRLGIPWNTWCGYFVGIDVVPARQSSPPFWRINHPRRQVMFSIFHLRPQTLSSYVDELRRRQLPWLHGYPSVLAVLARYLLESGDDLGYAPRWVTTGAENLMPSQIRVLTTAFGVQPRQVYGLAEGVANISECDRGTLHVDEDFAAVEFLANPQDPSTARLVGTNLSNLAFCLLRYDTGDLVSATPAPSCPCGHPGRVVSELDGRREDTIILADGTRLGRLAHIFQGLNCIREAQIRQSRVGAVTIRLVPVPGFGAGERESVLAAARRRLGASTAIDLELVTELPRSRNGKLRFVVSEIAGDRASL